MRFPRFLLVALLCFFASAATASAAVTNVQMAVFPDGGLLDPLDEGQVGGSLTEIPNPGAITVTAHGTGVSVLTQPLSWSCADHSPSGLCEDPNNDVWSFDFAAQRPAAFDVCGAIDAGFGFAGWSRCETYVVGLRQLFKFGRGSERGGKLGVPLRATPALQGQSVSVTATWFKARLVNRFGGGSITGSHCRFCAALGWRKTGSESQTVTLGPNQLLRFERALGRNTKVEISLDFPGISGAVDPTMGRADYWDAAGDCNLDLRGTVRLGHKHLPADLDGPRMESRTVACSSVALQKDDSSFVFPAGG